MLEELELSYEVKFYERDRATMLAPPQLRMVHPLGKSPVIVDGSETIAESGAIIEYLLRKYGQGRLMPPISSPEYTKMIYWLHYAEGSLMLPLLLTLIFTKIPKQPMPFFAKPFAEKISEQILKGFVTPQVRSHIIYCEEELKKSEWFAGNEISAADIQMSFPIEAAHARGAIDARQPKLLHYLTRIQQRPAYQRALARGGPYDLLS